MLKETLKSKIKGIDFGSDLHIDFYVKETNPQSEKFKKQMKNFFDNLYENTNSNSDILIIAGDISHYNSQTKEFLRLAKEKYKEVLITWGNHDMYMINNNIANKYKTNSFNRTIELGEICDELGVKYLDGNVFEINGIKIGGSGNWYKCDYDLWSKRSNDSRLIYTDEVYTMYGGKRKIHIDSDKLAQKEYEKLMSLGELDVLVTHVGVVEPTLDEGMKLEYVMSGENSMYYSNTDEIISKLKPKFHIFGHTHDVYDFTRDECQFVTFPLGYPKESKTNSFMTIEID